MAGYDFLKCQIGSDFEYDVDKVASVFFNFVTHYDYQLEKNISKIEFVPIYSPKGQIFVTSPNNQDDNKRYIVWDTCFWQFFEDFLNVLLYTYFNLDKEGLPVTRCKNAIADLILIYNYNNYSKWYYNLDKLWNTIFSAESLTQNDYNFSLSEIMLKNKVILYSKQFVLYHELEHILMEYSPEIYETNAKSFNYLITECIKNCDPDYDVRGEKYESYINNLNNIIEDKPDWHTLRMELYYDMHGIRDLTELYEIINNNDIDLLGDAIATSMFSIKLLSMFRSIFAVGPFYMQAIALTPKPIYKNMETLNRMLLMQDREFKYRQAFELDLHRLFLKNRYENNNFLTDKINLGDVSISRLIEAYNEVARPFFQPFENALLSQIIKEEQYGNQI